MKTKPSFVGRVSAALLLSLTVLPLTAAAQERIYFSAVDDVRAEIVKHINAENVRIDMSAWYLTDRAVSLALLNRFKAGVPVRLIGDRGSIFEIDERTKLEFYWLASQGVPIRLRFNPTWFPEIAHWKATIFVGQGIVTFGSANYTPFELAPFSATNYKDETVLFTDDPSIVNAFKTKFDRFWADETVEPESRISGPPYFLDWDAACRAESACSDYRTLYPNPVPMVIDRSRLEGDSPMPPDIVWGQGPSFNNRLVQEINDETQRVDFVIYRLTVPNITEALRRKHLAGVPVRLIIEPNEYRNEKWPEFWLTSAYVDQLWALGVPVKWRTHDGLTHMKMLVTSRVATNASANFAANWQRDHNYFVPAATKPAIYQAMADRFDIMWNADDFETFYPLTPRSAALSSPSNSATGVSTTPTLRWNRAAFATSYDIYMGTAAGALSKVANVPAALVQDPPLTYSWVPPTPLQAGTRYYWQVVSRTNATAVDPSIVAHSNVWTFTTTGTPSGPPPSTVPTPWASGDIGAVGATGSASYSSGQFSIFAAGADIWGSADSFHFVRQTLSGDGSIVARVTSLQNTHTYAKAGVMIRESLTANSRHALLDLRPGGAFELLQRPATGGSTSVAGSGNLGFPGWLRLDRSGSTITARVSQNGSSWTTVGSVSVSMASTVYVGLAVTSHTGNTLTNGVFDSVEVTSGGTTPQPPGIPASPSPADAASGIPLGATLTWTAPGATSYDVRLGTTNPPPGVMTNLSSASYTPGNLSAGTRYYWQVVARNSAGTTTGPVWSFTTAAAASPLPSPWQNRDIGSVGQAGSASFADGEFTLRGAGADVWGSVDGFHFAYQPLAGDGEIVARVVSMQNTHTYAKAGVMLRAGLAANSAHVMLDMLPGGGVEFMRRATDGGATSYLGGTTGTRPFWLRLVRSGDAVTSFVSSDGSSWRQVGSTTLAAGGTVYAGILVSSHNTSLLNTAVFDQVSVWTAAPSAPPAPSNPSPANGATDVTTSPTLRWSATNATGYDVRFGTSNPPPPVASGLTSTSYSPGTLSEGRTYYWQVVARNSVGATAGPVWSFSTAVGAPPPAPDVVIYASDIAADALNGSWSAGSDALSPNGVAIVSANNGFASTGAPLANPTHYFDVDFTAAANTPYRIWLRLKALDDDKYNDAVWVQFSDAQANGSPVYPIGTTSGLLVNLATTSAATSLNGWGWQNGAYWLSQPTLVTFATTGTHRLRVQIREDGVRVDQIVLSPSRYLNTAPGGPTNDNTIVGK